MADAFNIKPFGLNVIPQRTAEQTGKTVEKAIGSLWTPVLDYLEKNENVFAGDITKEINKLNIQTMKLGMAMNSGEVTRNLDTKF